MIDVELLVYGYLATNQTFDPCSSPKISFLCPMQSASLNIKETTLAVDSSALSIIPGQFFSSPTSQPRSYPQECN
jgi:hypothetical protein